MRMKPAPIGQSFGHWDVLAEGEPGKNGKRRVLCRCSCGIERLVYLASLVAGRTRSCGHARAEHRGLAQQAKEAAAEPEPAPAPAAPEAPEKASAKQQGNLIQIGERSQSLAAWAREVGRPESTIRYRLKRGWSVEDAVMTPIGEQPKA